MASRNVIRRRAFDDGVDRWEINEVRAVQTLAGRVSRYADYSEETRSFAARRELAATTGVLLFVVGEPLEIVGANGEAIIVGKGEGFAGAIADGTSISRGRGAQAGVHVFMPPRSLAAVLATPLAEIANRVANVRDLIGKAADEIGGRLVEADGPEERFAALDGFLERRFADAPESDAVIHWSMARLHKAAGPSSSAVAAEIGWSRRHFARRFRGVTGFGPDRFRRIARFERFIGRLTRAPEAELAELAADCGYADQAHLTREVQDFAGSSPGEIRARLLGGGDGGVRDD